MGGFYFFDNWRKKWGERMLAENVFQVSPCVSPSNPLAGLSQTFPHKPIENKRKLQQNRTKQLYRKENRTKQQ